VVNSAFLTPGAPFTLTGPSLAIGSYQVTAQVQLHNFGAATTMTCSAGGPLWTQAVPVGDSLLSINAPVELDAAMPVSLTCISLPIGVTVPRYEIDALQIEALH
jgi:hypothetical protein